MTEVAVQELVSELRDRGVKLWSDGGLLRFSAAKAALTPPLMNRMRKHKSAILELLEEEQPASAKILHRGPVSVGQEALWLLHQQNPGSAAYNTAVTLRFISTVDTEALRCAFHKLVSRHEPLRTTFPQSKAGIEAVVHSSEMLDFEVVDATGLGDEDEFHRLVRREYETPFDLQRGPLMRVRLLSRTDEDHVLLISVHHIVFDAWSLWLLLSELRSLYSSEVDDSDCLLPKLPANFCEFARWQRKFPESEEGKRQAEYWRQQLSGEPTAAELLWDWPRSRNHIPCGATHHFPIDDSLAQSFRAFARAHNVTPLVAGLSVLQTLLFRIAQTPDSIVGITTSGRTRPEFTRAIGYFVNTLPIRSRLTPEKTFADVLSETRETQLAALESQDLPFAEIVHHAAPVREPGAPPLCRIVFGLQKPMAGEDVAGLLSDDAEPIAWGDAQVIPYNMDQQEGQFDLVLEMYETPEGYSGVLKYDANLMHAESAERLANQFRNLLAQVVADPAQPVDRYEIVDDAERARILRRSIGEAIDEPQDLRVDRMLSAQVARTPDAEAMVFGDTRWTFAQLDSQSQSVARWLWEQGIRPGDRVVVATRRTIEAPLLMLASLKLGAAYVPVSPGTPITRFVQVVEDCRPNLIVAECDLADALRETASNVPIVNTDSVLDDALQTSSGQSEVGSSPSTNVPFADFESDQAAYIIFTSGSTGTPKGIAVSHQALGYHIDSIRQVYETCETDRIYQFSDFTFDPSLEQMLVTWSVGGAVVFRGNEMPSVDEFWQTHRSENITIANLPPKYFAEVIRVMPTGKAWPESLRLMIVGGDVFPSDTISRWLDCDVRLLNAYGPTETVITATTFEVHGGTKTSRLPIGQPKPGSTAFVMDHSGRLMPIGAAGELCLGGPMLADGYVNLPESTADQFVEREIAGEMRRVYRTGDLARWNADGDLEFLGRMDRQVKIRGFRIELGDIEAALSSHTLVSESVVKTCHHDGETFLAAFVTVDNDETLDEAALKAYLKSRLPLYMVPGRIITVNTFPLLPSGKIDTQSLHAEPPASSAVRAEYVAPRDQAEQIMADVWGQILGTERVGVMDDFYALGGGSLQSLRIVSALKERGIVLQGDQDVDLSPQMLFQYSTIAELAPYVEVRG